MHSFAEKMKTPGGFLLYEIVGTMRICVKVRFPKKGLVAFVLRIVLGKKRK